MSDCKITGPFSRWPLILLGLCIPMLGVLGAESSSSSSKNSRKKPRATPVPETERAKPRANPDSEIEDAKPRASSDPEAKGAKSRASSDSEDKDAKPRASADPEAKSAKSRTSADPETKSAKSRTSADPETKSAKSRTSADLETKSAKSRTSADPETKSAKSRTSADPEEDGVKPRASSAVKRSKATPAPEGKAKPRVAADPELELVNTRPEAKSVGVDSLQTSVPSESKLSGTPNATVNVEELVEFRTQPAAVRALIESGLALAGQNLTYRFGSADPSSGGMDCSGFIYYVLRQAGLAQVPRDSSGLYVWGRKARAFRAVISRSPDSFEFDEMLPGDLLFWTGTYQTKNDPPISHVMMYLGTERSSGQRIMIGSSDGRTYHGQKRNGVSVFDFHMPRTSTSGESQSTFVGYARVPGLRD